MRTRDALIKEFNITKEQMLGINPKLSIWKELNVKLSTLNDEIARFHDPVIPTQAIVQKETVV